jgi:hypothetical protein
VPVFYGWIVVAVAFLTMGIGVTVTRAFSLLFPPIPDEFGWAFRFIAGAFSAWDAGVDAGGAVPRPRNGPLEPLFG